MSSSTDDVCPPDGAESAGARPDEQLHFTKDETNTICKRLLAGVAALQALAISLLIAINAGGSSGLNSSVLAEDTFILTIGHTFDDNLIDMALHGHFNETYQANVSDGASSFTHGARISRKNSTLIPFILLVVGLGLSLSSWGFVGMSKRAQQAGLQKALRISSVGAQMVPGVLFLGTAILLRADAEDAYKTLKEAGVENEGTGWGFFAAVFCAAIAQILAAIIQWTWASVWSSLDKDGQGDDVIDMLRMNNNRLPAYSRADPMGQPPNTSRGSDSDSVELPIYGQTSST
ncbi:hypothetical protein PG985_006653 [Apiospora marii]|uniref:uncharacterized protein n=1 Tax=Apiospora marii TaxID=335849 RepID=UPI003131442C